MTTQEKQNQYIMGTYGRFPVVLEQGKQESCQDETGKQYIDFGSGIGILWATAMKHGSMPFASRHRPCSTLLTCIIQKHRQILQRHSARQPGITTCFSATAVQKRMNVPSSWQESIALINTERVGIRF